MRRAFLGGLYRAGLAGALAVAGCTGFEERPLTPAERQQVVEKYEWLGIDDGRIRIGQIARQLQHWDAFLSRGLDRERPFAPQLEEYRRRHGLPLSLWPGLEADSWRNASLEIASHPCLATATLFLERIPAAKSDRYLQPEWVTETDDQGHTIRQWPAPMDAWVAGIEGEELLVPQSFASAEAEVEVLLAIRPGGKYRVTAARDLSEPQSAECRFPRSETETRACYEIRDAAEGTVRYLAYEGPCT